MIKIPSKQSKPVLEFATIKHDARAMSKLLRTYRSPIGKGSEGHMAIHHSQFSSQPYNFFVINSWVVGAKDRETVVVVNPKIISKDKTTKETVREACMSFPFRNGVKVTRYSKIKVSYQFPVDDGEKLEQKEEEVEGLMAYIFQHEMEHARGTHIYVGKNSH